MAAAPGPVAQHASPAWANPAERPPLRSVPYSAPEPPRTPSRWDGNHTGALVAAGPTWLDHAPPGVAEQGWSVRAAARMAFVAQILDVELGYEHAQHGNAQTGAGSFRRDELGVQVSFHPGLPLIVFSSFATDVAAGLHGYAGASVVHAAVHGAAATVHVGGSGERHSGWAGGIAVGVGVDVPVGPRSGTSGLWLVGRGGLRMLPFGPRDPAPSFGDVQVLVGLNWRAYTTSWARLPRPF
ncbi:MAG: hypothetical protein EXR79_06675 [Myxococcales bacterium]|nr:hypothetical protein [Myxococcales bacterium]